MVSVLDDSPDGNTYNILPDLALRLGDSIRSAATWESADPDDQARCAISATLMIDALVFEGTPSDDPPTQTRAFPRDGLTDKYGTALADGTTPEEIKQAHAMLSYELLVNPELEGQISTAASAVKKVKAGSAEVENFAPGAFVAITRFPPRVQDLLNAFLGDGDDSLGLGGGSEDYGTGASSHFDDCDVSDLSRGLG